MFLFLGPSSPLTSVVFCFFLVFEKQFFFCSLKRQEISYSKNGDHLHTKSFNVEKNLHLVITICIFSSLFCQKYFRITFCLIKIEQKIENFGRSVQISASKPRWVNWHVKVEISEFLKIFNSFVMLQQGTSLWIK